MKKNILFSAYSLGIGGIETALTNLLNFLVQTDKYNITLVLEKKEGELLKELDSRVNIIEYTPSYNKYIGKIINMEKRIRFIIKYKNKFDCSFSYATYCKMGAFTAQTASENCNLWVHSSYLDIFKSDENKYKTFFNELNVEHFKNIIFVSNLSKNEFDKIIKQNNTLVCNNIISAEKIIKMSCEDIEYSKNNKFTFLYVGRVTEDSKKFSRLVEAANELKNMKQCFKVLVIGDGDYLENAKECVERYNLKNYIDFIGTQTNPYPYFKIADSLILVSDNEGYPVVFNEAKILKLPIITTNVSDAIEDIQNKYGIVCNKDSKEIAETMKNVIENGFYNLKEFDVEKYNNDIFKIIEKIIEG